MHQSRSLACGWGPVLMMMAAGVGCGDGDGVTINPVPERPQLAESLFVAHQGKLVSYDIASGEERPGAVQGVSSPTDLQALDDGTLLVNLTDQNHILVVDPLSMLEVARVHTSFRTAQRPVHSYISPTHSGKSYWMSLNDGTEGEATTNSACFLDITKGSDQYLQHVGEVPTGIGHHKATFSATRERVVVTNIADCERVLAVYDYSDIRQITEVAALSSAAAGWDGSSFAKTCDPSYQMGLPPAPHGCATSKLSGKAYCNLTGSGDLVVVDIDADVPTFRSVRRHRRILVDREGSAAADTAHSRPGAAPRSRGHVRSRAPDGQCQGIQRLRGLPAGWRPVRATRLPGVPRRLRRVRGWAWASLCMGKRRVPERRGLHRRGQWSLLGQPRAHVLHLRQLLLRCDVYERRALRV